MASPRARIAAGARRALVALYGCRNCLAPAGAECRHDYGCTGADRTLGATDPFTLYVDGRPAEVLADEGPELVHEHEPSLTAHGRRVAEGLATSSLVARVALAGYRSEWPSAHVATAVRTMNSAGDEPTSSRPSWLADEVAEPAEYLPAMPSAPAPVRMWTNGARTLCVTLDDRGMWLATRGHTSEVWGPPMRLDEVDG